MPKPRFQVIHKRAAELQTLPLQVQRLARLCDGLRTLPELSAAANLPPERTTQIVDRLVRLGFVSALTTAPRKRRNTPQTVRQWLQGAPEPSVAEPAQIINAPAEPAPPVEVTPPVEIAAPVEAPPPDPPIAAAPPPAPAPAPTPTPTEPAFTAEEDAFFSSTIDHLIGDDYYR
jgi:hypothetical protein